MGRYKRGTHKSISFKMGQKTNQESCRLVNRGFNIYYRKNAGCPVRQTVAGKKSEKETGQEKLCESSQGVTETALFSATAPYSLWCFIFRS